MLRFIILCLGMLTTRAARVDTAPLRDRRYREEPRPPEEIPDAEDTWITAGDQPRTRVSAGPVRPDLVPARRLVRRRRLPWWAKWAAGLAVIALIFRKALAFVVITMLSAALHLVGLNIHLPHIDLAWPWTSITAGTTTDTNVGPWVLQKIEGISRPALGTETFNFVFTHKVSKNIGFWPCWYSSTFYAVGRASATVDLNPGATWWAPSTGHYRLQVLSRPVTGQAGRVAVTIVLPPPQLPQSVHDISVDNTLSHPIDTQHSWTYPGFGCGALIKPQFSESVLYGQAQNLAFTQATTNAAVTKPLIAAAENEATQIIRDNFVQPTVNALGYTLTSFSIRWAGATSP
ncbi:MAG TPA: hypothetical protein VIY52_25130 [Streptosporangiaceae bacterium]